MTRILFGMQFVGFRVAVLALLGMALLPSLVDGATPVATASTEFTRASAQTAQSGQVWFVSPAGKDSNQCTRTAQCATLYRGFRMARPGDVVELASGTFPAQTVGADPAKGAAGERVVFQPAAGATVTLAGFTAGDNRTGVGPTNFELRDVKVRGVLRLARGTANVILRNVGAGVLNLTSTRNVQVLGGDYGPWVDGVSHINACGVAGCFPAEDILIDGALFHDYTVSDPAKHSECLMIWPGRRVTIRNSTFRNCTDFDVLVKPYNTGLVGSPADITFENNFFDSPMPGDTATAGCNPNCPRGGNAIAITDGSEEAWSGVQIRYNSSLGGIRVDPAVSNVVVKGNIARRDGRFACGGGAVFSYNVWSAAKCSPTDRTAQPSDVFLDPSSSPLDLRLKADSRAVGAGDPADHPKLDISGRLRPVAFAPDAGAWQREPALVVTGRAVGTARIGATRAELIEFYGRPRTTTLVKLPDGTRLPVDNYRVRGGNIRVTFRDERAVAIATTSEYYRTDRGLGPGASLRARAKESAACRPVGGAVGKARLYVRPTRSKKPLVAELVVVAPRFTPLCALPPAGR